MRVCEVKRETKHSAKHDITLKLAPSPGHSRYTQAWMERHGAFSVVGKAGRMVVGRFKDAGTFFSKRAYLGAL